MECVDNLGGDPASGRNAVAITPRPITNRGTLFPIDRGTTTAGTGGATTAAPTDAAAGLDPLLQIIPQLGGVLRGEIDLVVDSVERKFDGLVGSTFTVEIINKRNGNFFRH